jgi:hypothetical protein
MKGVFTAQVLKHKPSSSPPFFAIDGLALLALALTTQTMELTVCEMRDPMV